MFIYIYIIYAKYVKYLKYFIYISDHIFIYFSIKLKSDENQLQSIIMIFYEYLYDSLNTLNIMKCIYLILIL